MLGAILGTCAWGTSALV